MSKLAIVTAQSDALEPEEFQSRLIENLTQALLGRPSPPCLLRAPTGSGKTFMLARVLANVSAERPTLWLWFVPFVTLVQQTEQHLAANCPSLTPVSLAYGRNQEPKAGTVLLSTAQAVARARDRTTGYADDSDDLTLTLAELKARAEAMGLAIGLVVDEAHIGLAKGTEFGKFARWLKPEFLVLATATPKDERLHEFLAQSGRLELLNFSVSRLEAVEARLNKRYIEAVIYEIRDSIATIADLKRTVLRQAWLRHQWLKTQLQSAGVPLTPLLLVQVANGDKTVEDAERDLVRLCKVSPAAIGKHSADAPDPVLMAAIANDTSKEVLIFKQSAGTGFDAPRAFVLASTKTVNEADFAMQFIGRVMRVAPAIRAGFSRTTRIPADLDTAYVYLADADAQKGFASAIQRTSAVKSQLEGQTERLFARETSSGAVVYTNRETVQSPLYYPLSEEPDPLERRSPVDDDGSLPDAPNDSGEPQKQLWDELAPDREGIVGVLDVTRPSGKSTATIAPAESDSAVIDSLLDQGIATYRKRDDLPFVPTRLRRERRPELADMAHVSRVVVERFHVAESLARRAVAAASDRLREREVHTELTLGARHSESVEVIVDRRALAKEAIAIFRRIPQVEEEDISIMVRGVSARLESAFALEGVSFDDPKELQRRARDAAFWVIRSRSDEMVGLIQEAVAEFTIAEECEPLPDAMVFPVDCPLSASRKNIYGVLPPSEADLAQIGDLLGIEQQASMQERAYSFSGKEWRHATYDQTLSLNKEELQFAKSLDDADFVVWWHRNPDRKRYSVRIVRADHENYFYPDFVVCLEYAPETPPETRLIETKDDTKDAARKALRIPLVYGKVLFVTRDKNSLRAINDDGSLGHVIDRDNLDYVESWMRETRVR